MNSHGKFMKNLLLVVLLLLLSACRETDNKETVTIWHQMVPAEREILNKLIIDFEAQNPEIHVRALYKETEELRSGFQAAALAGSGPELIYGPSDVIGPFQTMGVVQDMSPWFEQAELDNFIEGALTFLPAKDPSVEKLELLQIGDRIGNHLALVYNRNFIKTPPTTTDELIEMAVQSTADTDGDGRIDQYGIVWNYTEPFFVVPFLTGFGAWLFEEENHFAPNLDTPQSVAAYEFVLSLRDEYGVIPANCDYEMADALFKEGKASMIINGDWSWGGSEGYLAREELNAAVAPLPIVSATGLPMGPMVATKGYSLNANASGEKVKAAIHLIRFLTTVESERQFMSRLKTLPSRRELLDDPLLTTDATLRNSAIQMQNGRAMPVIAELRAIWDSMRPHYQALLGGAESPAEAAHGMQVDAINKIRLMNQVIEPGAFSKYFKFISMLFILAILYWQRKSFTEFLKDWQKNRIAYLFVLPALLVILFTIAFPFIYNVVLSLSNMSLRQFRDWQVVGFQNYIEVFKQDAAFYSVFFKTVVWTGINVVFHVTIGIFLAVVINAPILGRSIYRVLLIIPWAVPAYITALTWRGMFDYEYGAINLLITKYLSMPMVNWLGSPLEAFSACILTNIWLGFPFMMVVALGGLQAVPQELYEAARVDGASRRIQFFKITLPLLKPVMLPAATLGTIWTFNNLNVIWLVSNGGEPSDKTHILVSYVYKAVFNLYQYGYGAALSMVIFVVLLVFSLLFLRKTSATKAVY
jgi:arabinogalactan oligomer / maltooligosaccharide transport system permease protein